MFKLAIKLTWPHLYLKLAIKPYSLGITNYPQRQLPGMKVIKDRLVLQLTSQSSLLESPFWMVVHRVECAKWLSRILLSRSWRFLNNSNRLHHDYRYYVVATTTSMTTTTTPSTTTIITITLSSWDIIIVVRCSVQTSQVYNWPVSSSRTTSDMTLIHLHSPLYKNYYLL